MILSHNETKRFIDLVLSYPKEEARNNAQYSEPELVAGVMEHGHGMSYTSDQWADFISKVPNILFRDEHWLMNKLSEKQRRQLRLE